MHNKRRNWIMVSIAIIEVFVVSFLVARVVQTCCTAPATTALPTLIALNPIPITQTTAAPVVIEASLTATPIPDTATPAFSPTPSPTSTSTASQIPPSPTSTPTASVTALPNTLTSTTAPAIAATTVPSSTSPSVVSQPTIIVLPTVAIPTPVTPSRIPPTSEPPTPTLTPSPNTQQPTRTPVTPTLTLTPSATRPTPLPTASGQCSWSWATKPLPEITDVAQLAINNAGLTNVTVRSEAYGENCYDSGTHELLGFSAMTTDFYLVVPVTNLNDSISLAQIIKTVTNTLSTLNVPLPAALGVLRITFTSGSDQKVFAAQIMSINYLITSGASDADILAAGGIK